MNEYFSCLERQEALKKTFQDCASEQARYEKIIQLGRNLPPFPSEQMTEENRVKGCQSNLFLYSEWKDGRIYFKACSDALISAGLAAILLHVYNGETAEAILKCPPKFLEDLGIQASLSPNRANGLYSIHLKMQQDALKLFAAHIRNSPSSPH